MSYCRYDLKIVVVNMKTMRRFSSGKRLSALRTMSFQSPRKCRQAIKWVSKKLSNSFVRFRIDNWVLPNWNISYEIHSVSALNIEFSSEFFAFTHRKLEVCSATETLNWLSPVCKFHSQTRQISKTHVSISPKNHSVL